MSKKLADMNPDSESVYDEKISPLMTQIVAICFEHRIPILASFHIGAEDDGIDFMCTTAIPFGGMSDKLQLATNIITQGLGD